MAADLSRTVLLPDAPLPDGCVKVEIGEKDKIEVYSRANDSAVIVATPTARGTTLRHYWSATQDVGFSQQLLAALRQHHAQPGKRLVLHLAGSQAGLLAALAPLRAGSEVLAKAVSRSVAVPADVTYRTMQSQEAADFFPRAQEAMAQQAVANRPDLDLEQARAMAKTNFSRAAPQGVDSPGHAFVVVQEAATGIKVADFWASLDGKGEGSFCYYFEVVPEKRRMGYGRKTLLAWEHQAAKLGASTLGANVFAVNAAMRGLCVADGFEVKDAAYVLQD